MTSKTIHLEEPVILEQAGYTIGSEGVMMMELLRPSAPDLYPTPRRPRRGTPDSSFGTSRSLSDFIDCFTLESYQVVDYTSFYGNKRLGVFVLPPG